MDSEPLAKKCKLAAAYTDGEPGTYTAVLEVEGVKLYIIHELLGRCSKVFRTMFNGKWKEGTTKEVELPGKSLQSVVWMLDYLYPHTNFEIEDHKSMALLPLAVEYQMETLQHICEDQLMERIRYGQSSIPVGKPQLVMLTLAERLQLKELTTQMIEKCAARLTIQEIERQKEMPENNSLPAETYHQLIKKRLTMWDMYRGSRTVYSCSCANGLVYRQPQARQC